MKLPSPLLVGSLAVNAAVLALYFSKSPAASPADPATASSPTVSNNSVTGSTTGTGKSDGGATAAAHDPLVQVWSQLQSGDLATLVARLRAAGFSASMIRSIVSAQVSEQFSARRRELFSALDDRPFWKSQQNPFSDPKLQTGLRTLGKEQNDLLKSLLGADYLQNVEEVRSSQRRVYGNVPVEKLAQLQVINSDYGELSQEICSKANGMILSEDREKLDFLAKEKLADIARALTPQEFEEHQFRTSSTANQLRSKLAHFEVNETEFRALYKLPAAFEAQYNVRDSQPSPEKMAARPGAEKQLQAAILASLPPDRVAEYKLATDPNYQQVNRLFARLELPPATSRQVVALQQDIQARANTLRSDRTLAPEARNAQLTALRQEATTKLSTSLTPRGLEAYKQNGGFWIQSLQPRPTSTLPSSGTAASVTSRPGG
ncbi:MAG: hypothetical protein H7343_22810 [Undibacterium sp.]|nr:hypothetical protein [Opitutaceae bacterium]